MTAQGNVMTDQRATKLLFALKDKHRKVVKRVINQVLLYHHIS